MNWDALGAIGELLGAVTVVATLIYLAIQVRHGRELLEENRRLALSEVHTERTRSRMEMGRLVIESGPFNEALTKFWLDEDHTLEDRFSNLSPNERMIIRAYYQNVLLHQDNNLYQSELNLLDEEALRSTTQTVLFCRPIWEALKIEVPERVNAWHDTHKHLDDSDT